jgi:hypothetical protein
LIVGHLRQFVGTQNFGPDCLGVVQSLETWRKLRKLVVAEIAWEHARGDYQKVESNSLNSEIQARRVDGSGIEINAGNFGQHQREIFLLFCELANRRGDLGWSKNRRCHLV